MKRGAYIGSAALFGRSSKAAFAKPHSVDVAKSTAGNFTSLINGVCTAWIWAHGGAGIVDGSGAAMKTFPVQKDQVISWAMDAAGNIVLTATGVSFSATVGAYNVLGTGVGGDVNRAGTAWVPGSGSNQTAGKGADMSDTYLAITEIAPNIGGSPNAVANPPWRGGRGGLYRTLAGGGGYGGQTPGGGGGGQDDATFEGGLGRVILVFSGG